MIAVNSLLATQYTYKEPFIPRLKPLMSLQRFCCFRVDISENLAANYWQFSVKEKPVCPVRLAGEDPFY